MLEKSVELALGSGCIVGSKDARNVRINTRCFADRLVAYLEVPLSLRWLVSLGACESEDILPKDCKAGPKDRGVRNSDDPGELIGLSQTPDVPTIEELGLYE